MVFSFHRNIYWLRDVIKHWDTTGIRGARKAVNVGPSHPRMQIILGIISSPQAQYHFIYLFTCEIKFDENTSSITIMICLVSVF